METTKTSRSRRNFLFALGAAGAGAATVAVTRNTAESTAKEPKSAEGKGFRLTEHIKNYYRTARV